MLREGKALRGAPRCRAAGWFSAETLPVEVLGYCGFLRPDSLWANGTLVHLCPSGRGQASAADTRGQGALRVGSAHLPAARTWLLDPRGQCGLLRPLGSHACFFPWDQLPRPHPQEAHVQRCAQPQPCRPAPSVVIRAASMLFPKKSVLMRPQILRIGQDEPAFPPHSSQPGLRAAGMSLAWLRPQISLH